MNFNNFEKKYYEKNLKKSLKIKGIFTQNFRNST